MLLLSGAASGRVFNYPPDSLYAHFCTRETLDSAYVECRKEAQQEETSCKQACSDYPMAEWAYENS